MPGITAYRKIQLGRETTAGTAVAATTMWRGMGVPEDRSTYIFPDEHVGILPGTDRIYSPRTLAGMAMQPIPATFEQLPHILEAGVKMVNTGAADGSGSGKIYAYTGSVTSANTIKTYTIEGGDDQQEEELEYGYVEEFTLEGKGGEALMMSANWAGRQITPSTFTAALTPPTVAEILFSQGKLYIDASGGTLGTTQKSNTLLSARLNYRTGWTPVWTADGQLYFSFIKLTPPEVTLEITFEHDATSVAEKAAWRAKTGRLVRLAFEGPTLTTAGTTYSKKTLRIDLAGKWERFNVLEERDGNDIVTGILRARYNSTDALFANLTVVNELTTIP